MEYCNLLHGYEQISIIDFDYICIEDWEQQGVIHYISLRSRTLPLEY